MTGRDQNTVGWRHILGTLTLAVLLEQMPWSGLALVVRPDFVLVGVLFWALHQPGRIGFGAAFFFGLLADFQDGAVYSIGPTLPYSSLPPIGTTSG